MKTIAATFLTLVLATSALAAEPERSVSTGMTLTLVDDEMDRLSGSEGTYGDLFADNLIDDELTTRNQDANVDVSDFNIWNNGDGSDFK